MIELRPLFRIEAEVGAPQITPDGPYGTRRFIPVTGGRFIGARLSGTMLAGGADCQLIRPDGVAELDVRTALHTDDGVTILLRGLGLRHGTPEVMDRLAHGEDVPGSDYYFREFMLFEAPEGTYGWLNRILGVARGERRANQVLLDVFEVA